MDFVYELVRMNKASVINQSVFYFENNFILEVFLKWIKSQWKIFIKNK
jgi:hypothetical protein